jgi:uncharacterized membrane protein
LGKELVNPNWHVALIHFPLGLFMIGVLIELFSFMWRRHAFRAAGRWMIFIGALSAIPAVTSGIYALSDVSRMGQDQPEAQMPWKDVVAVSPLWKNAQAAELMRDHVLLMAIATAIAVLVCVAWIGCSDRWRARLHLPMLVLLLVSFGLMATGAWHSGEAIYTHGVGVELEGTRPVVPPTTSPSLASAARASFESTDSAAGKLQAQTKHGIERVLPPLQTHVLLAGVAVAVAMAALALSLRAAAHGRDGTVVPQVDHIASALGQPESTGIESDVRGAMDVPAEVTRLRIPSARFWMLAFLIALLTALVGDWVLARGLEITKLDGEALRTIMQAIRDRDQSNGSFITRRLAHLCAGGAIIVLPLLLAMFARFAPRARFMLLLLSLLLVAAVAAQIWLGVLLMYDTNVGPVTGFN